MAEKFFYEPQEPAMAPGIVRQWPATIPHPTDRRGRLVRRLVNGETLLQLARDSGPRVLSEAECCLRAAQDVVRDPSPQKIANLMVLLETYETAYGIPRSTSETQTCPKTQ